MKNNDFVTIDQDVMRGRPVFKGTRVPIDGLFEYLESGMTIEDFIRDYPAVSKEKAVGVLELMKCDFIGA